MSGARGIRGGLSSIVPNWLSNRLGLNTGFKVLWVIALFCDIFVQLALEGLRAAWPGKGDASALSLIGLSRGLVRGWGTSETDAHFAARLRNWIVLWREAGTQLGIARQLQEFLSNHPRIRVVNRHGQWTTLNTDGSIVLNTFAWDWDSVSNPERTNYWSDEWVIVYPSTWSFADNWGVLGDTWGDGDPFLGVLGLGHDDSMGEYSTAIQVMRNWKAAHSNIRAVIWTTNPNRFDPDTGLQMPDGRWGQWGVDSGGTMIPSNRDTTECRYWEGV